MADQEMSCPFCHGSHVVKYGRRKGRQLYRCRNCDHQFRSAEALGRHFRVEVVEAAIEFYRQGWSYRKTARLVEKKFDISTTISSQTVHRWVKEHIDAAVEEVGKHWPVTRGHWIVFHMPFAAGDGYLVADEDTFYILSSHFRFGWDKEGGREAIGKALATVEPDQKVISCVFRSSDPVRREEADEVMRQELPDETHVATEEWEDPFSVDRVMAIRLPPLSGIQNHRGRFQKPEAGQRSLAGAVIMLNFFTDPTTVPRRTREEATENPRLTPGQEAEVRVPFSSWLDVVKMVNLARERKS